MGAIKVFIKPFKTDGTYQDDFIDVTADVSEDTIGSITQKLDGSDFDTGVFTNSSFSMKLNNQSGSYNDVGSLTSMFNYRRAGTLVRVTWLFGEYEPILGSAICGEAILGPQEIFYEGILEDKATTINVETNLITFNVLGRASIFEAVEIPSGAPVNTDTVKQAIFDILDQTEITTLLTVTLANIDPDLNFVIDDVSDFENGTVKEVLDDLLAASNSVLVIEDDVVYVKSRDESTELIYTFYGQASPRGIENIANITNYKNGMNRTFNLWTWEGTSLVARNTSSIDDYGVRKKEISYGFVTNNTTRQAILDNLIGEFGIPKVEFDLKGLWDIDTIQLDQLDKISVDYPSTSIAIGDNVLPLYGVAKYGTDKYPFTEFSLTIDRDERFKIIGITVNLKMQEVTFKLREV